MNHKRIAIRRLLSQQIVKTQFSDPGQLVSWMGAIQAQDFAMAKWALGIRLPKSTSTDIEHVFNQSSLLRTHVLRPTWHVVTPTNIHWLLDLTAPHVIANSKTRWKELELDEDMLLKCRKIVTKELETTPNQTREELMLALEKAKIATDGQRAAHIMAHLELTKLVCSGAIKEKNHTYTLLDKIVPAPIPIAREEAIIKLARIYFTSHGPATMEDFVWWSGLPIRDVKKALAALQSELISERIEDETYMFSPIANTSPKKKVFLLPAFDEFIISYKTKHISLLKEHHAKAVSNNGIFRPTILVDGQIVGVWKRTISKNEVVIKFEYFDKIANEYQPLIEKEAEIFSKFLGLKPFLIFPNS